MNSKLTASHHKPPPALTPDEICTSQLQTISDTPVFPINIPETLHICKMLWISSIPMSLSSLLNLLLGIISLGFIGNYGTPAELAGASLATTWGNSFYTGICTSINIGFLVIAAQLFGANKHVQLAQAFQKTLYILAVVTIPLLILVFSINKLSMTLEPDQAVNDSSQTYLLYLIPSFLFSSIWDCMRSYLVAQNYFYPQGIIQAITAILHVFWCYFFVVVLDMPLTGTAIAKGITDLSIGIGLLIYLKFEGLTEIVLQNWNKAGLDKWVEFLGRVMTIGANVYVQWTIFGILGFMIGALNDEHVTGGHGLGSLITVGVFLITSGNSITMQTYIGNAVGAGWKNRSQKVMLAGFSLDIFLTVLNTIFLFGGADVTSSFLTNDPKTKEVVQDIMYLYGVIYFADTLVDHMAGILRALGRGEDVLKISVLAYLVVGIPLLWIAGFSLGFGFFGLWIAYEMQIFIIFVCYLWKITRLDWDGLIYNVKQQIKSGTDYTANYIELQDV